MNPWVLVGFGAILIASVLASFHVGRVYERAGFIEADLKAAEKVIVRDRVLVKEVPKIVTQVVTKEVTVTKEVERVVVQVENLLAPDCVLPDNYGLLLVSAANGVDPTSRGADAFAGVYGCREVLAATLLDLKAGWINSARLEGLQQWAHLVAR